MDEKGDSSSCMAEEKIDCLYPMFFGVSCAFFVLRLLPEPEICDEKWSRIRNRMLRGSAYLLGLFAWSIQKEGANVLKSQLLLKLENAQKEIGNLKKIRSEDAKANQRVVSIIAAREQSWFEERKRLRQRIGALMNDLRVLEISKDKSISELHEKLKESENLLNSKDSWIDEEEKKRKEVEEKLKNTENLVDELRENAKREAQKHSSEISKHKTAFIELVSNQRQLEAEMGRALRQVEAAKQEVDSVLEQKEQSVLMAQRLSLELVKMRKDLEQKDQILSAMLRKSKLDTAEKQMLLKEVKSSKAKRQQAELETAKWKAVSESKQERHTLRNMLSKHVSSKSNLFSGGKRGKSMLTMSLDAGNPRSAKTDYLQFELPQTRKGLEVFSVVSEPHSTDETEEKSADVELLQSWVNSEAEKYKMSSYEQRHNLEIDAFSEQLRIKDEKLEAYRWRMLSMEIESKRCQSHIDGLDHDISQLRHDNMKLEALLLDREAELHSLKKQLVMQFNPPNLQKLNVDSCLHEASVAHDNTIWSKVKVIKRKPGQERQETKEVSRALEVDTVEEIPGNGDVKDIVLTLQSSFKAIDEPKVLSGEASSLTSHHHEMSKNSNLTWKMDIHALGVSYKIKRLKQQLLMLERLTGKQESCENSENNEEQGLFRATGFNALMSLLNKQIDRYESLQGKTDDLCKRMHENNVNLKLGGPTINRTTDQTRKLEHFLEETFQVQRYIVATGQKLMEVQTKIACGFVSDSEEIIEEKPERFDMKRFADSIRTLFREVQRGLEVRISRIIGDLEGTLAFDGMKHFKN